ncbi:hypothetical protein [Xanthomonas sp. 4461]|uniref:hypothetical protein n=1 Tax=Xanthomonas sp. 4461 TaxID=3035313 RepID=UPI002166CCE0|nr:hypothetical protein [Xanthomonas sp. 4461]MCS3807835.1 hypothetical protein [Xanthomonas sp. 4461]
MSWASKHPLVQQLNQMTPEGLRGKELSPLESLRSMVETTRCIRESVSCQRAATVSFFKRDQLAVRLKHLDQRIAYWEARAEELETQQGGRK